MWKLLAFESSLSIPIFIFKYIFIPLRKKCYKPVVIGVLVYLLTQVTKCHQVPVFKKSVVLLTASALTVPLFCVQARLSLDSMHTASTPSVLAVLTLCTVSFPYQGNSNPGSRACEEGAFCQPTCPAIHMLVTHLTVATLCTCLPAGSLIL